MYIVVFGVFLRLFSAPRLFNQKDKIPFGHDVTHSGQLWSYLSEKITELYKFMPIINAACLVSFTLQKDRLHKCPFLTALKC
jgi:hypothetical protein